MASHQDLHVLLRILFVIEMSRLFSLISNDWHVRSLLQVESKDSTTLKSKLQYADSANTSEGITSCDARYLSRLLNFLFIFPFFGTIDDGSGLASLRTHFLSCHYYFRALTEMFAPLKFIPPY